MILGANLPLIPKQATLIHVADFDGHTSRDLVRMDLHFVNVSDPRQIKTGAARKFVRSHAMRHFRQRQRLEFTNGVPVARAYRSHTATGSRPRNDPPEDNLGKDAKDMSMSATELGRVAVLNRIELFPVALPQRYLYKIFDHYGSAVAGGLLPLGKFVSTNPLRTRILPLAIRDSALFHVILANAGMDMMIWRGEQFFDPSHRSSARGWQKGTEFCMKHKIEGMRVINERLNNPIHATSDETILAVCHLASLEILASATKKPEERFKDIQVHMDGFEQMVKLRGGLRAIGPNNCITQLILRVDHLYSALTGRKPRFTAADLFDPNPEINLDLLPLPLPFPQTAFPPSGPSGMTPRLLSPELEIIICQLRSASQYLEDLADPISEDEFFTFGIKRFQIEDGLFKLGSSTSSKGNGDGSIIMPLSPMDSCCQFGALLYIQTVITKVNCKVYKDLCTVLRYRIEQATLDLLNEQAADMLLWLLLVGGGAAPYNDDRLWYIQRLVSCLRTPSWREVEERLEGWPWRPKYCVIWKQVWRDALRAGAGRQETVLHDEE